MDREVVESEQADSGVFVEPSKEARMKALGRRFASATVKPLLYPELHPDLFPVIPKPNKGDWLYHKKEFPQGFMQYKRLAQAVKRQFKSKTLYVLLLGNPQESPSPPLLTPLFDYAKIFFAMETVDVLPTINIITKTSENLVVDYDGTHHAIRSRWNVKVNKLQISTTDVYKMARNIKCKGFVVVISAVDLYPDDNGVTNGVFGESDPDHFMAVFSYASLGSDPSLTLWRCCSVMTHELCHAFGLTHCFFFLCLMNGTIGLRQNTSKGLHLCPVCLHKMVHVTAVDPVQQYRDLLEFYRKFPLTFSDEITWMQQRLEFLNLQT